MASADERNREIGRLYAEAILHVAEEKGQAEELLEELNGSSSTSTQSRARPLPGQPDDRGGAPRAGDRTGLPGPGERPAARLAPGGQPQGAPLAALRAIAAAYRAELRDLRGWVDVDVRTAVPLTDALRQRLEQTLAATTGRKPTLIEKVDPSVIGGLVVEVEGRKIDASVASRLHDLSEALMARASHEIHSGKAYVAES